MDTIESFRSGSDNVRCLIGSEINLHAGLSRRILLILTSSANLPVNAKPLDSVLTPSRLHPLYCFLPTIKYPFDRVLCRKPNNKGRPRCSSR
jgi:hypothetical protein